MKKVYLYLLCLLSLSSCNFLDFDETNALFTRDDMYKYFNKSKQMLTNVYSYMPQGFNPIGGAMRDCASDDAIFADMSGNVQLFCNGNWSPVQTVDDNWGLYKGIRAANEFIESIADADFSRFENNEQYENWMAQLVFFPYEARVLRAYYFFELARRYGDIAMPLDMLTTDEANNISKTPFNDVIGFIVSECDECAPKLPLTYSNVYAKETGRVTRGFAMAVKSKALLYAASPVHNPDSDKDKWIAAAKAAWNLIDLKDDKDAKVYSLDPNGVANNLSSKEAVLFRMNGDDNRFELDNFPVRLTNNKRTVLMRGTYPSQNLVDAFQTINGYSVVLGNNGWVTEDPDFNPQLPYIARDKRFSRTVLAHGTAFKGETIDVSEGGADCFSVTEGGSPTGYFIRKYIQETTSFATNKEVKNKHHWVVYRLAEAYLTLAESLFYAYGDPNYTDPEIGGLSAMDAINIVRRNASMPNVESTPAYPNATTKEGFVKALQNEWRVEFAFEDHRFWDIRRWKIGGQYASLDGVKISRNNDNMKFVRTNCQNRSWNDKMYLYPIPQSELYKNSNLNPQNTGW